MKVIIALMSMVYLTLPLSAEEEISAPVNIKVKLDEAQKKQAIKREITSVYNRVFGVDDFFAKPLAFETWNGKKGLVKRVKEYVKWRGSFDLRLKAAMVKIQKFSEEIEHVVNELYSKKAKLSALDKASFESRLGRIEKNMNEFLTELGSMQVIGLLVASRSDAREVMQFLALHIQNVAITAQKHLKKM